MIETAGIDTRGAAREHARSFDYRRWGALLGGGALAVYGLTRRSPLGYGLAAGGGALAVLGAKSNNKTNETVAHGTVLLNCFPEEAYRFWRDFENLPRFMRHLETVSKMDDRRSRWIAVGPMGKRVRWDAEITNEAENQFISWHSLEGSDIQVDGSVEFRQAPAQRGTLVTAIMRFPSLRGSVGAMISKIIGKDPSFLMRQDLRRFKALIETGEIPTTEGQSHGPRDVGAALARIMDRDRPMPRPTDLREAVAAERRVS